MAPLQIRPCANTRRVMEAVQGHWLSACLGVLMKLKIPEILASAGENTMSFAEVCCAATRASSTACWHAYQCEYEQVFHALGRWQTRPA